MRSGRLVARVTAGSIVVESRQRGQATWTTTLSFADEAGLADALASLAEPVQARRLPPRLLVIIGPPLLQSRSLTEIPPVHPRELDRLVARSTRRFFRQNGHDLVSAATWEAISPPRARAVAVETGVSEAVVTGAARAGLWLEDLVADPGELRLSLLPEKERLRRKRESWLGVVWLGGFTLLLWFGVLLALWIRQGREARSIDSELKRLEEPLRALMAARQAMDSASELLMALDEAAVRRQWVARDLAVLVRALPDSTYLTALTIEAGGRGSASGRTRRLAGLLRSLDSMPGMNATLTGVPQRDSLNGAEWERFTLQLTPEPAP